MEKTYFFTGFPGFLARNLVTQLLNDQNVKDLYVLVLPKMADQAEKEIEQLVFTGNINRDQIHILYGDITKHNLGLDDENHMLLSENVTHLFHLAAIYDLAVPKDIAYNVNVTGTKNVNNWVLQLRKLQRYVYFSTAYVSGTREGVILETELEKGQSFKNYYEYTKYEAEVLVEQIKDEAPVTIIRPGVVCGHSKTGETIKFDGPYFMLNIFDSLKRLPVIPYIGRSDGMGNFVPVDYIFKATIYLAHLESGSGKTYHLADPNPYKMRDVYRMLMKEYLGKDPKWAIPLPVAKLGLSLRLMRRWLGVEKESLDYSIINVNHDCQQAQEDLKGSGIQCPDFKDVVPAMVQYYQQYKDHPDYQVPIN
ncbi:SDR family oxidoreductase [Aquisalibacillus elongatus]|uniref:Thioester reductase-like protein n=1 Tax=Aquisalibacillus elongatus TaxID=485577 RepID=A0A3N5C567_9BACI|nr:SDR family oxidoreductase [Aquisalibacillus elongatus]RPF53305.1 thioester reductase-like protein [Aquisalibacillus elongatus]